MLKTYNAGALSPEEIKSMIEESLDLDKAQDIKTINLKGQTSIADYMIVASGTSTRQVAALAEKIRDRLKAKGLEYVRIEGLDQCNWVVLDAGDVIVHLFRPEVRDFYNIEKMWQMGGHSSSHMSGVPAA